jgi:hypothetical protein
VTPVSADSSRPVLTTRLRVLDAAVSLDAHGAFTAQDLVVRAWQLYPESFALRGYAAHPDSNAVLAKVHGTDGVVGRGWLAHHAEVVGALVVTAAGRLAHATARGEKPARVTAPPRAVRRARETRAVLTDVEARALGVLAKTEALRKFLRGSPLTFVDACTFWSISAARPVGARQTIDGVGVLLARAVESFGLHPDDPRLPGLATCFGLLNVHRILVARFAREIEALEPREVTP